MQRVAIGRALVRQPAIYLMDEPLSSLDAKLRAELRLELKRIQQRARRDHPLRHPRPDRGDDHGRPHRRHRRRPAGADRHAARDLRATRPTSMSRRGSASRRSTSLPRRPAARRRRCRRARKTIGARTEHLRIAQGGERPCATATVDWVEHLGDQNHLHLDRRRARCWSRWPIPTPGSRPATRSRIAADATRSFSTPRATGLRA